MRALVALLLLLLPNAAPRADQGAEAAWSALARGGVALIRHAATDGGTGDPVQFKLDDCATQRNLSPAGRGQAAALGEAFREHRVVVRRILSSPWCRCRETARLMALGPVEQFEPLSNLVSRYEAREAQMRALRPLIVSWRGPGALLLVSHGSVILPLAGVQPREGEIVVVEPRPGSETGLRIVGRIPPP